MFKPIQWPKEKGQTTIYITKIYMHADLNFKLMRIIYTLREKNKMYVSM
jgi:hypothetical protein